MFLPVLLVRDYGFWAWVVFAIPNVIGAAAMGWALRDAESSQRFVEAHRAACAAFSWVTVAFHLFFAAWILTRFGNGTTMAIALLATAAVCWIAVVRQRTALLSAAIILAASVVVLLLSPLQAPMIGTPSLDVLYLASACVFGFALCPYLDLTFHRARQSTSVAGGRLAFGLGFGVMFFAMIVFTIFYVATMLGILAGRSGAPMLLGVHLVLQSGFTIAVHLHQLGTRAIRIASISIPGVILCAAALGLGFAPFKYPLDITGVVPVVDGEVVYRCFMAFYALIFPAYVWICAWPLGKTTAPTRRSFTVFAIAVLAAAPFFWMGFIERAMIWVVPGVGVVVVAGTWPKVQKAKAERPTLMTKPE